MLEVNVRDVTLEDAGALAGIYNHFVAKTIVTFEEEPVTTPEMARRIHEVRASGLPWLVAEQGGAPVGFALATPWRSRPAYRYSTEVTVYVATERAGHGIGSLLYARLLAVLQGCGVHAAMGGIALPNDASVALHEKLGFKKVAHFEQAGFKFNRWIDVGYWQIIL